MGRITESLIRQRAEHNEGLLQGLEEIALHQQNIEKIELLGHLAPHLKILYLQNNLISKIQNLHKLKELQYLNLAVNNITKVQNLQRCESLQKLDLTVNFIPKAGLLSLASLQANLHLNELYLLGNPCADWHGYRQYVVAKLPQLQKLDGQGIKRSERIAALQVAEVLEHQLRQELLAEGVDPDEAASAEDDSLLLDENGEVAETGYVDESGELRRPWCPATRILEHREMERLNAEAEAKKRSSKQNPFMEAKRPLLERLPPVEEGATFYQKNEGQWDFVLQESDDGRNVVLDVALPKYLDTSLIEADVQPTYVRLLIKGRLLQLLLPAEVRPDKATAQRSIITGHLVLTMPKERPDERVVTVACMRPSSTEGNSTSSSKANGISKGSVAAAAAAGGSLPTLSGAQRRNSAGKAAARAAGASKAIRAGSLGSIVSKSGQQKGEELIRALLPAAVQAAGADDDDAIPAL